MCSPPTAAPNILRTKKPANTAASTRGKVHERDVVLCSVRRGLREKSLRDSDVPGVLFECDSFADAVDGDAVDVPVDWPARSGANAV